MLAWKVTQEKQKNIGLTGMKKTRGGQVRN